MNSNEYPFVSIIMPVRNEARYIVRSLGAVLAQDYPSGRMEVIVADGISTDGTREIVHTLQTKHSNLLLIDNPDYIVPTGLNAALALAQGEVIVRMDGHCEYPSDYMRRLLSLMRETGADGVGGVLVAVGSENYTQESICAAYYSPLSAGRAQRSYTSAEFTRDVDAVWGGCWMKETLVSAGQFDETMVRNQDDELSFRLRKKGGRIVQDSRIQVRYYVRDSFIKLLKQFVQYGYWKVPVIRKHPRQANPRHFIPAAFVMALIGLALLAPFHPYPRWGLGLLSATYVGMISICTLIEAARTKWKLSPGILLALATMHIGYGGGCIIGMLRWVLGPLPTDPICQQTTR